MQFLVRKTTHTTGETFTDVTKIRDNETYQVVEAESKEEAEEKYKAMVRAKVLRQVVKGFKNFKNNVLNMKGQ